MDRPWKEAPNQMMIGKVGASAQDGFLPVDVGDTFTIVTVAR